jgi:catechol 2,3-dioxygenase-like lactoylglutathione lyase family enzyme
MSDLDWRLEVVTVPVSDVDRAKEFYVGLGFRLDVDRRFGESFRVVQLTPRGSACSISLTRRPEEAGSQLGLHLVVADIEVALMELIERGTAVTEVFHFESGRRLSGPDPERRDYGSFFSFRDPDGNMWMVQEVRSRNGSG